METCVIQQIKTFDELEVLLNQAYITHHENIENYKVDNMKERWNRYRLFTKLIVDGNVASFSGVYDYGKKLVRVVDRLFTFPNYRQNYLSKSISYSLKPAVDYFIPYQTKWAKENGFDCFFSIQEFKKRNSLIRLTKQLDTSLKYRVLPDMYETCDSKNPKCIQNVSATKDTVSLIKHQLLNYK